MRLIDADAVPKWYRIAFSGEYGRPRIEPNEVRFSMNDIEMNLLAIPTVDAVPVVHGEWIPKEKTDTPYGLEMECAKCGFSVIVNDALYFKFCPNCGARMDEEEGGRDGQSEVRV